MGILVCLSLMGCADNASKNKQIIIKNTLDVDRLLETVAIDIPSLDIDPALVSSGNFGIV